MTEVILASLGIVLLIAAVLLAKLGIAVTMIVCAFLFFFCIALAVGLLELIARARGKVTGRFG